MLRKATFIRQLIYGTCIEINMLPQSKHVLSPSVTNVGVLCANLLIVVIAVVVGLE